MKKKMCFLHIQIQKSEMIRIEVAREASPFQTKAEFVRYLIDKALKESGYEPRT